MTISDGLLSSGLGVLDVRILVVAASLREESPNTRLAHLAAQLVSAKGGEVDLATVAQFDAPSFNADLEVENLPPAGATEFRQRLQACDAFIIASPEYNASMPGHLKNTIDWMSRFRPQPFNELPGLLMSASPSMMGGNRGLWSLRIPFEHLGARIYPDMFSLAPAHHAFDANGQLADVELQRRFESTIQSFMELVEASKHYHCAKKVWVEYLGERLEPDLERVE
ncbi:MAG: NAD(P)H-dependent oxidoreductase [Actinomycetota bacterium]|nr:NAD(P)H-dependent oxidoreductase [Actinomycetota bacterium]